MPVAFENSVETFLNKMVSDVKTQGAVKSQLLEEKSEIRDVISETVLTNDMLLSQVKDVSYNVRTEVKEIHL